jgi:hypothetical protein
VLRTILRQYPGDSNLRHADSSLLCDILDPGKKYIIIFRQRQTGDGHLPVHNSFARRTTGVKVGRQPGGLERSKNRQKQWRDGRTHQSVSERLDCSEDSGLVRAPRARGDHGMEPTPKYWKTISVSKISMGNQRSYLERREHLPLIFSVQQRVVVLHRNEGG